MYWLYVAAPNAISPLFLWQPSESTDDPGSTALVAVDFDTFRSLRNRLDPLSIRPQFFKFRPCQLDCARFRDVERRTMGVVTASAIFTKSSVGASFDR